MYSLYLAITYSAVLLHLLQHLSISLNLSVRSRHRPSIAHLAIGRVLFSCSAATGSKSRSASPCWKVVSPTIAIPLCTLSREHQCSSLSLGSYCYDAFERNVLAMMSTTKSKLSYMQVVQQLSMVLVRLASSNTIPDEALYFSAVSLIPTLAYVCPMRGIRAG
jgi:hypothetical protein